MQTKSTTVQRYNKFSILGLTEKSACFSHFGNNMMKMNTKIFDSRLFPIFKLLIAFIAHALSYLSIRFLNKQGLKSVFNLSDI